MCDTTIQEGDIFEYQSAVLMRIEKIIIPNSVNPKKGIIRNCVNLETGELSYISDFEGEYVFPCFKAELNLRPDY